MTRRSLLAALLPLLALPALAFTMGGWAIITVDNLPEYLVAGETTEIGFTVRQHGVQPLARLSPRLEASGAGTQTSAAGFAVKGDGRYAARITIPRPGDWTITVQSGFLGSNSVLLPIPVIERGSAAPASMPPADRGARLFVAKGCVGCHVHGMVGRPTMIGIGPDLTARRYPAAYLTKLLANPADVQGTAGGMPNLLLRQEEISALVAFINSDPAPARR